MLNRTLSLFGRRLSFYYRSVGFLPHPDKVDTGGEDAYLSMSCAQSVLDGVSWWRDHAQVNAGLYSAAVARSMNDYINDELLGDTPASSFRLLDSGYEACKHGEIQGTCTVVVATLQERQEDIQTKDGYTLVTDIDSPDPSFADVENYLLDVVLVGDCGLLLLRNGNIIYATEEQAHDLDFPYQIGTGSPDTPKSGIKVLVPVRRGDVVIMGSDGIFDNLYHEQVAKEIWEPLKKVYAEHHYGVSTEGSAPINFERNLNRRTLLTDDMMAALDTGVSTVLKRASDVSKDIRCDSPYASKCIEGGALYEGGKPDDMAVLASVIGIEDDDSSGERFSSSEARYPAPYRDWP